MLSLASPVLQPQCASDGPASVSQQPFLSPRKTPDLSSSAMPKKESEEESKRPGPGRPGEDRYFRLAVRLKLPTGNWLKSVAKKRRTTMTQVVEEIIEAEIKRQGGWSTEGFILVVFILPGFLVLEWTEEAAP
jgi:hypothetical protein